MHQVFLSPEQNFILTISLLTRLFRYTVGVEAVESVYSSNQNKRIWLDERDV